MRSLYAVLALIMLFSGCLWGEEAPPVVSSTLAEPAESSSTTVTVSSFPETTYTLRDYVITSTTSSTLLSATTSSSLSCPRGYAKTVVGCCVDVNGNGLCDRQEGQTTTTSTTLLSGYYRLFDKVANRSIDMPLTNSTSGISRFYYQSTTTSTIEGITAAYKNKYNSYYYRGYWHIGGHANDTKCFVNTTKGEYHLVKCPESYWQ
ncbi:MAG: hypothetical protein V1875_07740 [Candidatus Altiarchaeota archaeon]